jgi:hypothetical protein
MRQRSDTRRSYDVWLRNHIVPKWGDRVLSDVQARPVELWIESLALAPKSKVHIRGVLSILWDFAMWRGDVATERNPMELARIKGATKENAETSQSDGGRVPEIHSASGRTFPHDGRAVRLIRASNLRVSSAELVGCRLAQQQTPSGTRHRVPDR